MPTKKRDYWPTQGWKKAAPEEQGMDSAELLRALQLIEREAPGMHSVQVVRHGYLVLDAYFYPYAAGLWHSLASVTKSFTSTLIGIALDKGLIKDVKQPVLGFFPGRKVANRTAGKESIRLENLLTMSSGLHCIFEQHELSLQQMQQSPDWVQFVLDQPMDYAPGSHYVYCSPGSHLLSAIIQQASGMSTLAFAQKNLFAPLGISRIAWPVDPQGVNFGWGQVRLGPYDMAKLGYLYLNEGVWDGQQVLSRSWITAATMKQITPQAGITAEGYGYQWWILSPDIYSALGRAGQNIAVIPARDMVSSLPAHVPRRTPATPGSLWKPSPQRSNRTSPSCRTPQRSPGSKPR